MKTIISHHLVLMNDLNHHRTLYGGRSANWLIETAYLTAVSLLPEETFVLAKINEICFFSPVHVGDVLRIEGKAIYAGRSSLIIYTSAWVKEKKVLEGFFTIVHVDNTGKPLPHGITIDSQTGENRLLQNKAKEFLTQQH